jgi:hypothetical protein
VPAFKGFPGGALSGTFSPPSIGSSGVPYTFSGGRMGLLQKLFPSGDLWLILGIIVIFLYGLYQFFRGPREAAEQG